MIIIKTNKKNEVGVNIKKGTTYEEIITGSCILLKNILDHSNYELDELIESVRGVLDGLPHNNKNK